MNHHHVDLWLAALALALIVAGVVVDHLEYRDRRRDDERHR